MTNLTNAIEMLILSFIVTFLFHSCCVKLLLFTIISQQHYSFLMEKITINGDLNEGYICLDNLVSILEGQNLF
jgi:hypothetical protein